MWIQLDPIYIIFLIGFLGLTGGLLTIPIFAIVSLWLKRDEIRYQSKLDMFNKLHELLLQHQRDIK